MFSLPAVTYFFGRTNRLLTSYLFTPHLFANSYKMFLHKDTKMTELNVDLRISEPRSERLVLHAGLRKHVPMDEIIHAPFCFSFVFVTSNQYSSLRPLREIQQESKIRSQLASENPELGSCSVVLSTRESCARACFDLCVYRGV